MSIKLDKKNTAIFSVTSNVSIDDFNDDKSLYDYIHQIIHQAYLDGCRIFVSSAENETEMFIVNIILDAEKKYKDIVYVNLVLFSNPNLHCSVELKQRYLSIIEKASDTIYSPVCLIDNRDIMDNCRRVFTIKMIDDSECDYFKCKKTGEPQLFVGTVDML